MKSQARKKEPNKPKGLSEDSSQLRLHPSQREATASAALLERSLLPLLPRDWQSHFSLGCVLKVKDAFGEQTNMFLLNATLLITVMGEM